MANCQYAKQKKLINLELWYEIKCISTICTKITIYSKYVLVARIALAILSKVSNSGGHTTVNECS